MPAKKSEIAEGPSGPIAKLKKCTVKINRMVWMCTTPAEAQEQMQDLRIRRCAVRVKRCHRLALPRALVPGSADGQQTRRFCIKVLRLQVESPQPVGSEFGDDATSEAVLENPVEIYN